MCADTRRRLDSQQKQGQLAKREARSPCARCRWTHRFRTNAAPYQRFQNQSGTTIGRTGSRSPARTSPMFSRPLGERARSWCRQPGLRPASETFDENSWQGSVFDHDDVAVNQIFLKRVKPNQISASSQLECQTSLAAIVGFLTRAFLPLGQAFSGVFKCSGHLAYATIGRRTPPPSRLVAQRQALFPIQPVSLLLPNVPALTLQQHPDLAIPITHSYLGDLSNPQPKSR